MAADNVGKIVIVGGGIIGCSVAYHLTELGVPCTLVERCSIACAASGKAGGFLARYPHICHDRVLCNSFATFHCKGSQSKDLPTILPLERAEFL